MKDLTTDRRQGVCRTRLRIVIRALGCALLAATWIPQGAARSAVASAVWANHGTFQSTDLIPVTGGPKPSDFDKVLATRAELVVVEKGGHMSLVDALLTNWTIESISTSGTVEFSRQLTFRDVTLEEFMDELCDEVGDLYWATEDSGVMLTTQPKRGSRHSRTYDVSAIWARQEPLPGEARADRFADLIRRFFLKNGSAEEERSLKVEGPEVTISLDRRSHKALHKALGSLVSPLQSRRTRWAETRDWNDLLLSTLDDRVELLVDKALVGDILGQLSNTLSIPLSAPALGFIERRRRLSIASSDKTLRELLAVLFPNGSRSPHLTGRGIVVAKVPPMMSYVYDLESVQGLYPAADGQAGGFESFLVSEPWLALKEATNDRCDAAEFLGAVVVHASLEFHHQLQRSMVEHRNR